MYQSPTSTELDEIDGWGANYIRLVIQADDTHGNYDDWYEVDGTTINTAQFAKLDTIIDLCTARDIKVGICMLTCQGYTAGDIWDNNTYWTLFKDLWKFIAYRYNKNDTVIAYELMNEPNTVRDTEGDMTAEEYAAIVADMQAGTWEYPSAWVDTTRDYYGLMEETGQALNLINPDKVIIVPPVGIYGDPINFSWQRELDIDNLVYTFHMYEPATFTGAGNTTITYDSATGKQDLLDHWLPAQTFASTYNAKMYVGEFGLLYPTEILGADEWMADVLEMLEDNNYPWSYWAYNWRYPATDETDTPDANAERITALTPYWALNT